MKAIIVGLAALAVLGGGGYGAYSYFMKTAQEAAPADQAVAEVEPEKKEMTAEELAALPVVELGPIIVPVIDRDGLSQTISLVISVEAMDTLAADKVKYNEPRLKNAYLQEIYGILNRYAALKGGVLAVTTLQEHLNKATDKILGKGIAHGVTLEVVQQRPV
ncbi:MAG: hypothetical protein LRY39_01280 [Alphaproteobacteria bacterium]|nr:hypothetical protein [Alphaproteobacteria bacterium]MCD8570852.1 hypothetical protein [Alphaproteobacteria bacterium]